ncbi:hypothetical protein F2Q68_00027044 [Brassica cretica]|uniref:Transposase MuDR plant domain-containing protein n=1 Tax=Brassica cretica TaxID=69181 RepID=A0A8S9I930_BRACR|nr:hypothetical protein F2Q68_00027044 [Brassica cretica]
MICIESLGFKGKFQMDVIGRYPSIVQQPMVKYMRLPIVDDSSLETMLEQIISKRSRQNDADESANVRNPRENNNNGWLEEENSTDDVNCGNNEAAQKDSKKKKPDPTKGLSNSVSKQFILSSSWLTERELYIGMLFRDQEELKKAVKLYSERRQRDYDVYDYSSKIHFRCTEICGWDLKAAKTNGNGFEITEYKGAHTCKPANVGSDFLAGEIEYVMKQLEDNNVASRTHDVLPLEPIGVRFQVAVVKQDGGYSRYVVHLNDRVCTCGILQLVKYPRTCWRFAGGLIVTICISDWPEDSEVPRLFPPGSRPPSVVQSVPIAPPHNKSAQASKLVTSRKRSTGKKKA